MNKYLKDAIEDGCEQVVAGLLADHPAWLERRDHQENTPLMLAVSTMNRDLGCIRTLLDAGADVNARTSEGYTVLHLAVFDHGYCYPNYSAQPGEFIPLLVKDGAKLEAVNHYGFTPLMVAILESGMTDIQALLDAGANPNAIVPDNGKSAFNDGQNILSLAVWHSRHMEVMRAVLEAGADMNLRDAHGRTTVQYLQAVIQECNPYSEAEHERSFCAKYLRCMEFLESWR